jgi:hypothetical protein
MTARLMIIAAAALMAGTSAIAEPAKPENRQSNPPSRPPAALVLASAEEAQPSGPAADQPSPAPVKHRAARVTTCRCGDPQTPDQ